MKKYLIISALLVSAIASFAQSHELLIPFEDYITLDMPKMQSGIDIWPSRFGS
jgi:hypothetical protein